MRNAEGSYKDYLRQTELALKAMAAEAKTEAARVAAEEAAAALQKIEDARLKAAAAPDAPTAKRTFMQWLMG